MKNDYSLEQYDHIPNEYAKVLLDGINEGAFRAKGLPPMQPFSIFIKDQNEKILGGISGTLVYGSLYVDLLWIDEIIRNQGWGTKLMNEAEHFGKKNGAHFMHLSTMDWEALPFYQKLGFSIEFIREGYDKNSRVFLLRKNF